MAYQIRVSVSVICGNCQKLQLGATSDTNPGSESWIVNAATERAREAGWKYVHIWQDRQTCSGEWRCPACLDA